MTDQEKIDQLVYKIGQAYQVIGILLTLRPDDFESQEGQRALDYFADEEIFDKDFLPYIGPKA